ncbi:unnamed protein product [Cylindrotheca closterium]|uniref:RING-type E3 ubiquitin transferase n=1 Tax=Cylindrotheca closterium TaxID=2856 RepID=A0AAD2FMQ3_9STRA|nr:unnamed protein product [Cylindrotheca closterium]
MFRKPKKSKKTKIRKRSSSEDDNNAGVESNHAASNSDDDDNDNDLGEVRKQSAFKARKKLKTIGKANAGDDKGSALHQFQPSANQISQKDLVTSTSQHHPTKTKVYANKLLAGPIRAAANIRTTCRFDYQPDICKDYKDTGFCGFGDGCIYLHDRGDQLSGWQLDQKWEEEQKKKKDAQQNQVEQFLKQSEGGGKQQDSQETHDGLPFACHICRDAFKNPVRTNCNHFFCEKCILEHMKTNGTMCPICSKDTNGVYHEPTKLLSKKRRLVGRAASWKEFMLKCQGEAEPEDS